MYHCSPYWHSFAHLVPYTNKFLIDSTEIIIYPSCLPPFITNMQPWKALCSYISINQISSRFRHRCLLVNLAYTDMKLGSTGLHYCQNFVCTVKHTSKQSFSGVSNKLAAKVEHQGATHRDCHETGMRMTYDGVWLAGEWRMTGTKMMRDWR